jgi:hypothetical protein
MRQANAPQPSASKEFAMKRFLLSTLVATLVIVNAQAAPPARFTPPARPRVTPPARARIEPPARSPVARQTQPRVDWNSTRLPNPNYWVAPGLSVTQAAYNLRTLGNAYRHVPPALLGANPYAPAAVPGSPVTAPPVDVPPVTAPNPDE